MWVVGTRVRRVYMKAQLSVKPRDERLSNAKSPVLGHFGAAMAGLGVASYYGHVLIPLASQSHRHLQELRNNACKARVLNFYSERA